MNRLASLALAVIVGLSLVTAPAGAQSTDFSSLQESFARLHRSLATTGITNDEDRSVVEGFLARVREFRSNATEHAGSLAMEIQLLEWLGEKDLADALYQDLAQLLPDHPRIVLEAMKRRAGDEAGDESSTLETYRSLAKRFPENAEICVEASQRLRQAMKYAEALDIMSAHEFDPVEEPRAVLERAECLFSTNRFAEAAEALESIPLAGLSDRTLSPRIAALLSSSQGYVELWEEEQQQRAADAEADDLPRVRLHTNKGQILLELFEDHAPNTVANFISLCESGFYQGTKIHRFIPDSLVQGGDPVWGRESEGFSGPRGPGYTIADEMTQPDHRSHFGDTISMYKSAAPNSAGSQFVFSHRPDSRRNAQYTVFGRILDGVEVMRSLRVNDEILMTQIVRKRDHDYEPETIPLGESRPDEPKIIDLKSFDLQPDLGGGTSEEDEE